MADNKDTTTVNTLDINLDELLGTPDASNVMLPEEKKPNLFSRKEDHTAFINNMSKTADSQESTDADTKDAKDTKDTTDATKVLDALVNTDTSTEDTEETKKVGRPTNIVELGTKLIEKGYLVPFEGEEDVSKYTLKDWEELFDSNEKDKDKKKHEEISASFYENLPEEFQVAAHYFANGGTDMKAILRSLAAVEEIRQLDTKDENSQEQIVRSYLHATQFGDAEEIEEEIEAWKDRDELEAKANKFKPKLDAMQEQIVARQLQEQEGKRKQQQHQAQLYTDAVYKTLEPGEINGLKLDKKTQNMLFGGLTQANYPSASGRQTNLLGHLLEKYQYVEPNPALISEVLWLLADSDGYKGKIKAGGSKEQVEKTVRQLKTEQSSKIASGTQEEDGNHSREKKKAGIQRSSGSFFKR
jgi:hypothetical protein